MNITAAPSRFRTADGVRLPLFACVLICFAAHLTTAGVGRFEKDDPGDRADDWLETASLASLNHFRIRRGLVRPPFASPFALRPDEIAAPTGTNHTWVFAGTSSWFFTSRWSPTTLPAAGDNVFINNGGRAQVATGAGSAFGAIVTLGQNAGQSGTIDLNGPGVLEVQQIKEGAGSGKLNIDGGVLKAAADGVYLISGLDAGDTTIGANGAYINTNGFDVLIGSPLGGSGKLFKQGAGALFLTDVVHAYAGDTIVNAGTLAVLSTINNPIYDLVIAQNAGENATLRITTGGIVNDRYGWIAGSANSTASAIVSGTWNSTNNVEVGQYGDGTLIIRDAGQVKAKNGFIAAETGSSGEVTIDNAAFLNIAEDLWIGNSGNGILTLFDGDVGAAKITLARNAGSTGTLNIFNGRFFTDTITGGLGTAVVNFDNDSDLNLAPQLTGSISVNQIGKGTTTLTNASSYTGPTTISAGILEVSGGNNRLPTTTILTISPAGERAWFSQDNVNQTVGGINFGGTGQALVTTGSGTLILGGNIDFSTVISDPNYSSYIDGHLSLGAASRVFNIADDTASFFDLLIDASISGNGVGITKTGAGTLTLAGANTYTGPTIVSAGRLVVDGSSASPVTVNGGIVAGLGTTAAATINSGGSIAPGDIFGGPGILHVVGNLQLNLGSAYLVDLNGRNLGFGGYDQIDVAGSISLGNSSLLLTLGQVFLGAFRPALGDQFIVVNNDGADAIQGTFKDLAEGAHFTIDNSTFGISYTGNSGNDVVVTALNCPLYNSIAVGNPAMATFSAKPPSSPPATLFVDIQLTEGLPENLMVYVFDGFPDSFTGRPLGNSNIVPVWDHVPLVDGSDPPQPVKHLQFHSIISNPSLLNNPPINLQFIDDTTGTSNHVVGFVQSALLTTADPSHVAPSVQLSRVVYQPDGTPQAGAIPAIIDRSDLLNLTASGAGATLSDKIERLGIVINETTPDAGSTPLVFRSDALAQPPSSNSGVSLPAYKVPVLRVSNYTITGTAVDNSGFPGTASQNIKVINNFGIVEAPVFRTTPDSTTPPLQCADPAKLLNGNDCPLLQQSDLTSCVSSTFFVELTLQNNTSVASKDLRLRVIAVPVAAFQRGNGPPQLPDGFDVMPLSISPYPYTVGPLAPGVVNRKVTVSGQIPAPAFLDATHEHGYGYHLYAVLEEYAEHRLPDEPWIAVDSRVIGTSDFPVVACQTGPGGGVNEPPPDFSGTKNETVVLERVDITGPAFVIESIPAQFLASATAIGATSNKEITQSVTTYSAWETTKSTISSSPTPTPSPVPAPNPTPTRTGGFFQPGYVATDTPVQLTATFHLGKDVSRTKQITVIRNPLPSFVRRSSDGHVLLDGPNQQNLPFKVQASVTPQDFVTIGTVTNSNGALHYEDANPGNRRFYRLTYP